MPNAEVILEGNILTIKLDVREKLYINKKTITVASLHYEVPGTDVTVKLTAFRPFYDERAK